jgi:hypothetical protein
LAKPSTNITVRRARLHALGLRPITISVPDGDLPTFRAKAHRQSLAVSNSAHETEDQNFIDAVSDQSKDAPL